MEEIEQDIAALRRERPEATEADIERLRAGEPLAYVIGTIPFLGLTLGLESKPLIPRPETEWWAEELCTRIGDAPLRVLDLCAGSGAIGLSVLKHCPHTEVSFGEIIKAHIEQIRENLKTNTLDTTRATLKESDLFHAFKGERFDIIAANPPYIPVSRTLPPSVSRFEPSEALFSGADGFDLIQRILTECEGYLSPKGELWLECDTGNIESANQLALEHGASWTQLRTDQYGRPRLLVAYY